MDFDAKHIENILNIFVKYYNTTNGTNYNMFSGIDDYSGTNGIMEEFTDCLAEFRNCDDVNKKLLNVSEIHVEEYEELYGLKINENIVCACEIIFPLINYIAKEVDWVNVDWSIILIDTQQNEDTTTK